MSWKTIEDIEQIETINSISFSNPVIIFKHSIRCSISSMAKARLERNTQIDFSNFYYLDLIAHRSISNFIADKYAIEHESPQVLIIKNGKCVYHASHNGITLDEIKEALQNIH